MARRIPKDAMTRALAAAGDEDVPEPGALDLGAYESLGDGASDDELVIDDAQIDLPASGHPAAGDAAGDADEDDADHPEVPDKLYFRIGEVAQLVGVDAHVLRYWETEFRMKPHRSSSGQRLYRKQDLSRFFRVKRLLHDEGYTIAGARKVMTGAGGPAPQVDLNQIREALERLQVLRDRVLELRDEMDPEGRA